METEGGRGLLVLWQCVWYMFRPTGTDAEELIVRSVGLCVFVMGALGASPVMKKTKNKIVSFVSMNPLPVSQRNVIKMMNRKEGGGREGVLVLEVNLSIARVEAIFRRLCFANFSIPAYC